MINSIQLSRIHLCSFIFLGIQLFISNSLFATTTNEIFEDENNSSITLVSHSFNAKQRSRFVYNGVTEHVERGLTIIHFMGEGTYEFKSFDTYGSVDACDEFDKTLDSMMGNGSKLAILAHDSAANDNLKNSSVLKKWGLHQLMGLKSRQAYIMHNLTDAQITEQVDDNSIEQSFSVPLTIDDTKIYFPKIKYEFEPNDNRYIAHAGGEIDGIKSTNSKEALDYSYSRGFRLFELDIIETSDGHLVAAHDWKMWSRFTDYQGDLPPSLSEFKKHTIYGDYHTMDMEAINKWFKAHPDAILITDKINDPVAFADKFVDKKRLMMELFSQLAIEEASQHGIKTIISQDPLMRLKGNKTDYLSINGIEYAAVSRRIISSQKKLMLQLREQGVKVYVYNVNFDPGKDEQYVYDNELGLVYGMYADKWVFDTISKSLSCPGNTFRIALR